MAPGRLPKPGTQYGPCVEACQHKDCAAIRAMAERICPYCSEPIGYERGFYISGGERGESYAHSVCLEEAIERKQVQ